MVPEAPSLASPEACPQLGTWDNSWANRFPDRQGCLWGLKLAVYKVIRMDVYRKTSRMDSED